MGLSYHWPLPWGFFFAPRVHILFQQHESKGRHFFLNLLFFVPAAAAAASGRRLRDRGLAAVAA